MRFIGVPVIWLVLLLINVAGLVTGLVGGAMGRTDYLSRVFRAHDHAAAAVLGWSGDDSVTTECRRQRGCFLCRLLCPIASFLMGEDDHCKPLEDGPDA